MEAPALSHIGSGEGLRAGVGGCGWGLGFDKALEARLPDRCGNMGGGEISLPGSGPWWLSSFGEELTGRESIPLPCPPSCIVGAHALDVPPVHTRRLSFFSSFRPLAGHFMEAIPDVDWLRGPEREHSLVDET